MAIGLLRVTGTIDLAQFWPTGSSDADTTKILVNVGAGAFKFRPSPGKAFKKTNAFRDATVIGRVRKKAIDGKNRITIRLQGIDAPELHYRPSSQISDKKGRTAQQKKRYLEVNEEYRQNLAETATVPLARFLGRAGVSPITCTIESAVDYPDEVFDTYGRFVGDIHVRIGQRDSNVNLWLVRQGLAFPAFYNSMSEDEINSLRRAADQAWAADRSIWPNLPDYVGRLDWNMIYRRPSQNPLFSEAQDTGPVVLPKLFRRLSSWEVNRYAKMVTGGFWKYLKDHRDQCYLTSEFLADPTSATVYGLHDLIDPDGFVTVWPEDLVFRESTSRLISPGGGDVKW